MSLFEDFDDSLEATRNYRADCEISCFACKHCKSPKLSLIANQPHGYFFVAGEPTGAQDDAGTVWAGSYKTTLLAILKKYKISMDKVSFSFAAACHGVKLIDKNSIDYEIALDSCSNKLMDEIEQADPAVIIPMDISAWDALTRKHLTGRIEKASFKDDFMFHLIPDQTIGRWLAPIISPQTLFRLANDRKTKDDFNFYTQKLDKFMKKVFSTDLSKFPNYSSWSSGIIKCSTPDEAIFALKHLNDIQPSLLAFDYETEGLKLEREDMHIVCVGLSCREVTYSMSFYWDNESFTSAFRALMTNPKIGKIAHHAKYEARCTLNKLGVLPEPWAWDTMYGSRILDNSVKCGLKPQTYINFGIAGYDSIEYYLTTALSEEEDEKWGNNHKNKFSVAYYEDPEVHDAALFYVGQDALYTLKLAELQMKLFDNEPFLRNGEQLFRSFINPLVQAEVNGMVVDKRRVRENMEKCQDILDEVNESIKNDELINKYWNVEKEGHEFSYTSSSDLGRLIYELIGEEPQYTDKGKYALDATTLERLPYDFTDKILEAKKISKIRETYLLNLKKESVLDPKTGDATLHAMYNLHVADTFRSSSSGGINLQNVPSHDKRANELIRSCILPAKGTRIIGADYRALEVTIGCSIHHDKNMLSFLESGGDMHRASMKDIFLLTDEEADAMDKSLYKAMRGSAKQSNFSAFYGAGFNSIGNTRWKDINHHPEIMDHLRAKGIGTYDAFMEHMKEVVDRIWTVQFPQYGEWRKDTYAFYQKHGYVELIDGFRCRGPLTSMQATNAPIQGPASHVLLWAFSNITKDLKKYAMKNFLINEIHDAVYGSVYPEEQEQYFKILRKWMIEEAPNKFPWITAPLAVEAECTELRENGGNWAQEIEIGMI